MTDLQKAAEKYRVENPFNTGTSGIDLSYLRKADFLAGFEYRDAEVERLREALNYARYVYAEACALGEDRIGLSEFDTKIEAILAKGGK